MRAGLSSGWNELYADKVFVDLRGVMPDIPTNSSLAKEIVTCVPTGMA
jgi:hypothetical protein